MFLPAMGAFLTGIAAAIASAVATIRAGQVKADLNDVKKEMNGHMQQLLKVTGESERAKGIKEGESRSDWGKADGQTS